MSAPQLLTPAAFKAWQATNATFIRESEERNQLAVDDYVIRIVISAIQSGLTLDDAGDSILEAGVGYGFRGGINYSRDGFRRALLSIGWRPKRERDGGIPE